METEEISKIEILENGEMFLVLASGGKPMYQYIYREAAEVYWDNERKAFKAPAPRKWSHADWYRHIVTVAASGLGLSLQLSKSAIWVNVSESTKAEICSE
jgi:integron cassette Hfx-like protein